MTTNQVREGRSVRITDPFRVAVRFWDAGLGAVVGAGGEGIARALLEEPGTIIAHGCGKRRVCIGWPDRGGHVGMWLDHDQLTAE